ncbi:MAG: dynamin family protein [Cyanobacterium sp. T60_A2020_053]|nr:dynamin family protein [Cyanobacterium sp. T60_A2020_053]
MTIVAPMSAGKSTIINAIIGNDLLPTSASAMTTIPTEIILDTDIDEPCLILDDDVLFVSNNTKQILKDYINAQEHSEIKEQLSSYPHLIDLAENIGCGKIKFDSELKGYKEIRETLTILNNIFRLYNIFVVAGLLNNDYNPLYGRCIFMG